MLIPLTRGQTAVIDDADSAIIAGYSWYAQARRSRSGKIIGWYAVSGKGRETILMHRLILDAPDGITVDHRDGNGLDNRRSNIRLATFSQNAANTLRPKPRSGYWGVVRRNNRFRAIISKPCQPGNVYLGMFATAEDAAHAYDRAALGRWGEFARLNFPGDALNSVSLEHADG